MKDFITLDILKRTVDDLSVGVGIFRVEDFDDLKSIRYIFMNKVILYEMRKEKEEVFGKRIIEVAPEAYEHEGGLLVIETYRNVARDGGSVNLGLVEYSNHMVSGTYECSVHHLYENYVYVMLRNVTELEQTKNELELKNRELSQFAYTVSHDLKEPLHTVSSAIEMIQESYRGKFDADTEKLFSYVFDATQRMSKLVTDLLDFDRIGKGTGIGEVDFGKLLAAVLEDLSAQIRESGAEITVEKMPVLLGFETELRMLFQNLISNAIKFSQSPGPPVIHVSAKKKGDWEFCVRDNGIGIPTKYSEQIFNVFRRLHSTDEFEGTGIGLANCKKIVDLHGGEIWVESAPGEGSSFYFTIPDKL